MLALLLLWPARLAGQCPDGTPPPCSRAAPAPPNSVAVLYFDNLTRDSAVAYLADGLTEELIVRLARMSRLEVRSRSDARRVRGDGDARPASLGRSLNAAYLLMGSLQSFGGRSRVTVELVRAATGQQVWGDVFDGVGTDPLAVQQQIAVAVATAVVGRLAPDERAGLTRGGTHDPVAYDLYLRARHYEGRQTLLDQYRAIVLCQAALRRDSTFAQAAAQLAYAYIDAWDGPTLGRWRWELSRAAANRALQLDSTLAEGYSALAWSVLNADHDAAKARQLIQRAVDLNPRSPDARIDLANIKAETGDVAGALEEDRNVLALDSLYPFYVYVHAMRLVAVGRLDAADSSLRRLREVTNDFASTGAVEAEMALARRQCAESLRLGRRLEAIGADEAGVVPRSLACLADSAGVHTWIDSAAASAGGAGSEMKIAAAYAASGEVDSAVTWLENAEQRGTIRLWFVVEDLFASLRTNARYLAILGRYGIRGNWR